VGGEAEPILRDCLIVDVKGKGSRLLSLELVSLP
jgi:hypothetical protein